MDTNRQFFGDFFSTSRTSLGCVAGIHPNHFPTSVRSFVGKKLEEYAPATIGDGLAQMSILDHVFNLQVFNVDSLKIVNVFIGNLMQKIISLISDLFVRLGDQYSSLIPTHRTFSPSGKFPLSTPKLFFIIAEIFRIGYYAAFAINAKRLYANVNTYFLAGLRELFGRHIVAGKGDEPFTRRHTPDSDGLDIPFNRTGQKQFESTHVSDVEIPAFKLISGLFKGEGIITVPVLKTWKTSFFTGLYSAEKSFVCLVKAVKHVLKRLGVRCFDFRKIFLDKRQLPLLGIIGNRFLSLFVSINPLSKRGIVDITAYIKPVVTVGLCFPVYFRTKKECFSHFCFLMYSSIARRMSSATDNPVCSDSSFSRSICFSVR